MTTVLVVEDYAPLRTLYQKSLTSQGFAVNAASTCEEAFVYLRTSTPDIVLLDMSLSDGSGMVVANYLSGQERFSETQVVIVTGNDQYQQIADTVGCDYYLYKPVSIEMLLTLMQRITVTVDEVAAVA